MELGFIGLGAMGSKMLANVIKAGHSVTVFDIGQAAVDAAVALGAKKAANAAETARGKEIVLLSLPNSAIVESTVLGPGGILEGAEQGLLIVDLSSITPQSIQKIAGIAKAKGVNIIDAPVSGGTAGAQMGTLSIMVGGEQADFERALPVLQSIGSKIDHVGAIGAGDTVKLVNNLLLGVNMVAVSEALCLGVKAGIKPEVLYQIISNSSGNSYALTAKYKKFIAAGNFEPGFMIDLQYKDLQLAVDTAKGLKVPLVLGNIAQQAYEIARASGLGAEDISAVIKLGEALCDIKVREEAQ
ncbi:NAD(P)-dependent oxidoreductase [Sporomusa sphaeroides]|uniref:2-(Hydroxymethyl)glutarate dehydrogenase n=2 Tax=Sporomusa TaxID=2375 RepID=A0ABP2C831_9FIRM|nr:NAD(P)-dependent oxidoreductase [Sporomusa sphaeroides]OLS55306.1 2-(hydroxymethyl)glutarate dehydrogenase [Sporomusa sphaeroides DSM 2875]CVK20295.1 2-(hydroxymethyl)glutarate dehydrogenase [Sporomusa sphaeroides DSM 2875]SCM83420.1 2-(hydroxymethyl)glutarate dehydrogenase [uncultured Sporomusa sp.]